CTYTNAGQKPRKGLPAGRKIPGLHVQPKLGEGANSHENAHTNIRARRDTFDRRFCICRPSGLVWNQDWTSATNSRGAGSATAWVGLHLGGRLLVSSRKSLRVAWGILDPAA